jgi:hypothetical protein
MMISAGRSLGIYKGSSYSSALSAYWQAVKTLHFLGLSGQVVINLTTHGSPHGGFSTEFDGGRVTSLHVSSGQCVGWAEENWFGENTYKKMIATVPGTLGPAPKQFPNSGT